jgi:hypothetical protein
LVGKYEWNIQYIQKPNFVHQIVYDSSHNSHHSNVFRHSMVPSSRSTKDIVNFERTEGDS